MTRPAALRGWTYGGVLFAALFVLCAISAFCFPRALAPWAGAAGLLALPLARDRRAARPGLLIGLLFVLLALVATAWNPQAAALSDLERFVGLKLVLQWFAYGLLVLAALRLTPAAAERASLALSFSLVPLAAILLVEGFTGAAVYQWGSALTGDPAEPGRAMRNVAQGAYILAVLMWPAAMTLRREGMILPVLVLLAGVVAAMFALGADAPAAALAAGAVAYGLVMLLGRPAVLGLAGVTGGFWLAAPWLVLAASRAGLLERAKVGLPESWDVRLDIWRFAAERIAERPLTGFGTDASRNFSPRISLHPHDAALQHWLELGLPGALLAGALLVWLFLQLGRRFEDRAYAAAGAATLVSFLVIASLSFSAWEEWWLATGALGLVAMILLRRFWVVEPVFENPGRGPSS